MKSYQRLSSGALEAATVFAQAKMDDGSSLPCRDLGFWLSLGTMPVCLIVARRGVGHSAYTLYTALNRRRLKSRSRGTVLAQAARAQPPTSPVEAGDTSTP